MYIGGKLRVGFIIVSILLYMRSLLVGSLLTALGATQSCSLEDSQKVDCGYMGINQSQC